MSILIFTYKIFVVLYKKSLASPSMGVAETRKPGIQGVNRVPLEHNVVTIPNRDNNPIHNRLSEGLTNPLQRPVPRDTVPRTDRVLGHRRKRCLAGRQNGNKRHP